MKNAYEDDIYTHSNLTELKRKKYQLYALYERHNLHMKKFR